MASKTFSIRQRTPLNILGGLFASSFLIALSGIEANPQELTYRFTIIYIGLGCFVIFFLEAILDVFFETHNWWLTYLATFVFYPIFTGLMAFNWATSGMTNWTIGTPLIVTYLLAASLPFINPTLAAFFHKELFSPTTMLGKIIIFSILAIGPTAGVFGVFLSNIFRKGDALNGYMLSGVVYYVFLCWASVSGFYQIWDNRPQKEDKAI